MAVVKNRRDLNLVLKKKWYRIPIKYAPKQKFKYIAFYSPKSGNLGGKITYYASIKKITHATRQKLLPKEIAHPRAGNLYLRFELGKIYKLPRPIKNKNRRRVSFGFTTLSRLKKAGGPERLVPSKLEGSRGAESPERLVPSKLEGSRGAESPERLVPSKLEGSRGAYL